VKITENKQNQRQNKWGNWRGYVINGKKEKYRINRIQIKYETKRS
jgi:hypothetical protein